MMLLGPNTRKLIAVVMAKDAIPAGQGLEAGVEFLLSKEGIVAGFRKAMAFVKQAINEVRSAAEPNPWKNASDEEIATEILQKYDERLRHRSGQHGKG